MGPGRKVQSPKKARQSEATGTPPNASLSMGLAALRRPHLQSSAGLLLLSLILYICDIGKGPFGSGGKPDKRLNSSRPWTKSGFQPQVICCDSAILTADLWTQHLVSSRSQDNAATPFWALLALSPGKMMCMRPAVFSMLIQAPTLKVGPDLRKKCPPTETQRRTRY